MQYHENENGKFWRRTFNVVEDYIVEMQNEIIKLAEACSVPKFACFISFVYWILGWNESKNKRRENLYSVDFDITDFHDSLLQNSITDTFCKKQKSMDFENWPDTYLLKDRTKHQNYYFVSFNSKSNIWWSTPKWETMFTYFAEK